MSQSPIKNPDALLMVKGMIQEAREIADGGNGDMIAARDKMQEVRKALNDNGYTADNAPKLFHTLSLVDDEIEKRIS